MLTHVSMQTWEYATSSLINRAGAGTLFIGKQGENPPGPAIVVHDDEKYELEVIREALGGTIYDSGRSEAGFKWTWVVYDHVAAEVLEMLVPLLEEAPRNRGITRCLCWARNELADWKAKRKRKE